MNKKRRGAVSISEELVQEKIYLIRSRKVMLDSDLAELYEVPTGVLIQAVKRNHLRFPDDFVYQLTRHEVRNLRSQFVISSWGGRRYLPYVFTEQGVAMLSSVLNSERAIQVNIIIVRIFVKLRQMLSAHRELAQKLDQLEQRTAKHDQEICSIFKAIRQLTTPPVKSKRRIGFHA